VIRLNDRPQPGSRYRGEEKATSPGRHSTLRFLPLALGTVAGVLLVIIAATLLSHRSDATQPPSVAPTARQICDDLTTQRYSDLYSLLSRARKAVGSSDQFAASQRLLDAQRGATHVCAYTIAGQDTASATLTLTLTRGSSAATAAQMRLTFEQNAWRIADYDSALVAAPSSQFSRVRSMPNGG
jgi:hypothetical protein